jgi:hypothetical protein
VAVGRQCRLVSEANNKAEMEPPWTLGVAGFKESGMMICTGAYGKATTDCKIIHQQHRRPFLVCKVQQTALNIAALLLLLTYAYFVGA